MSDQKTQRDVAKSFKSSRTLTFEQSQELFEKTVKDEMVRNLVQPLEGPKMRTAAGVEYQPAVGFVGSSARAREAGRDSTASKVDISAISAQASEVAGGFSNLDYDPFDIYAENLIERLREGALTISMLTKHQKFLLYRYFYKTNSILGRVVDLHTEIPLSKLRVRSPKGVPMIVKDFVIQFYNQILDRINLSAHIYEWVLQFWIYGESFLLVDDHYQDRKRVLQEVRNLDSEEFRISEEDAEFLRSTEKQYETSPESVDIETRKKYMRMKFQAFFDEGYTGPDRCKALRFYDIEEYFENSDVNFEAIQFRLSDGLNDVLTDGADREALHDLGYSNGFIKLIEENSGDEGSGKRSVLIDNDTRLGLPWIVPVRRFDNISVMDRLLTALIEWDAAKRALMVRLALIGKASRIVTSDGLSDGQLGWLVAEVEHMMEDPSYAIVANFPINWEEINTFIKDELKDLMDASDRIQEEISNGWGMPMSLIAGDSQYSGDVVKVEIINTQYFVFKQMVEARLYESFVKPIAERKGLIGLDSWGNPMLVSPHLSFSCLNLRSSDNFDLLFTLYQKGSLNVDVIYDMLNLDGDDIMHALKEDLWTLKNDKFNDVIGDILRDAADGTIERTDVRDRVIEGLGLALKEQKEGEGEEDEGYGF